MFLDNYKLIYRSNWKVKIPYLALIIVSAKNFIHLFKNVSDLLIFCFC